MIKVIFKQPINAEIDGLRCEVLFVFCSMIIPNNKNIIPIINLDKLFISSLDNIQSIEHVKPNEL